MTPRPLRPTEREHLATTLRALADELVAGHAPAVQRSLATAADPAWQGRRDSTVPVEPSNAVDDDGRPVRPDTPVERAVLLPAQPVTVNAAWALQVLRRVLRDAPRVLDVLDGWRPDRPMQPCPRCGHAIEPGRLRCQRIIDGVQCGSSAVHVRRCIVCQEEQAPGAALRKGRCDACRKFAQYHGYDKTGVARLALGTGSDLITDGVAHA